MTATTTNQDNARRDGIIVSYPVLASEIIYKGRPVIIDASSGYAQSNDGTTITLDSGDIFAGIAAEKADNSAHATNGYIDVKVYKSGIFEMATSDTITQANVGDRVYVNNTSDDNVVTVTSDTTTVQVCIGVIVGFISANVALVKIDGYVDSVAGIGNTDSLGTYGLSGNYAQRIAVATYDFAVKGGAQGAISLGVVIPDKAIVTKSFFHVKTAFTSGGSATVALGTGEAANDIKTATAFDDAAYAVGNIGAGISDGAVANMKKMTADRTIKLTIATADLTAGKVIIFVEYVQSV